MSMKILSIEPWENKIDYNVKKDLLIPCWLYKVPIDTSRDRDINFLEETVLKLLETDKSLENNIERLSQMIGFEDMQDIVNLVLKRLKHLKLSKNDLQKDIPTNSVTVYVFYQEAYTGELLPIITKEKNSFSSSQKITSFKGDPAYSQVSFKQDISSSRETRAILANNFDRKPKVLSKNDLLKTIYLHNQKRYTEYSNINYKNFNIDVLESEEMIYLHTKLYIPESNIASVVISNGFTNDYSTLFRSIYEEEHLKMLSYIRGDLRQDVEVKYRRINIPFESKIRQYPTLVKNIEDIEKNIEDTELSNSPDKIKWYIGNVLTSLYDTTEKAFEYYTDDLQESKDIKKRDLLHSLSIDIGFKIYDNNNKFSMFNVSSNDNLQKFFSKAIFFKKSEMYELAIKRPKLLYELNKLFHIRNGLKHSQKEDTLKDIDIEMMDNYKETVYLIISLILNIKQINSKYNTVSDDNIYQQNAYIDLETEISPDILRQLPQEPKDNLVSINYYLNELPFEENKYTIVKEIINQLSSTFEYLFSDIIMTLYSDNDNDIKSKDEILNHIRKNISIELGESLYRVGPQYIENAQKKLNGSLGAYFLVYLYNQDYIDMDMVQVVERVLIARKHSNPSIEEIEETSYNDLKLLRDKSIAVIKKLIEENYR